MTSQCCHAHIILVVDDKEGRTCHYHCDKCGQMCAVNLTDEEWKAEYKNTIPQYVTLPYLLELFNIIIKHYESLLGCNIDEISPRKLLEDEIKILNDIKNKLTKGE